jgi:hypothetical protein
MTGSSSNTLVTEGAGATLTYTGTDTITLNISYSISLSQADGANRDILTAIYKNGTLLNGQSLITSQTAVKATMSGKANASCATSDYFEVYVTNLGAGGDVSVYALQITAQVAGA